MAAEAFKTALNKFKETQELIDYKEPDTDLEVVLKLTRSQNQITVAETNKSLQLKMNYKVCLGELKMIESEKLIKRKTIFYYKEPDPDEVLIKPPRRQKQITVAEATVSPQLKKTTKCIQESSR
jgi:hypothetical protein